MMTSSHADPEACGRGSFNESRPDVDGNGDPDRPTSSLTPQERRSTAATSPPALGGALAGFLEEGVTGSAVGVEDSFGLLISDAARPECNWSHEE